MNVTYLVNRSIDQSLIHFFIFMWDIKTNHHYMVCFPMKDTGCFHMSILNIDCIPWSINTHTHAHMHAHTHWGPTCKEKKRLFLYPECLRGLLSNLPPLFSSLWQRTLISQRMASPGSSSLWHLEGPWTSSQAHYPNTSGVPVLISWKSHPGLFSVLEDQKPDNFYTVCNFYNYFLFLTLAFRQAPSENVNLS